MVSIQTLGVGDKDAVIGFLHQHYYLNDPITKALQITDTTILDYYYTANLADGCSFKAVNEAGEIIAIKLNQFTKRGDKLDLVIEDPKCALAYQLYLYSKSQFDAFSLVEPSIERILQGKGMSVRPDYRKQGLAKLLYKKTSDWMTENGVKYMVTTCSSHYTALACKKLGFAEVHALNYTDFVVDGVSPIVPDAPHTQFKIYWTTVTV